MIIETKPSHPEKIYVWFEESDFELKDKWGGLIWVKAKDEIKETFPYPMAEWNKDLACWLVDNSDDNMAELQEIRRKYFEDENQMELL